MSKGKGVFQSQFAKPAFGSKGGFGGKGKDKSGIRAIDGSLKVWVGGLPEGISVDDVKSAFGAVGTVQDAITMKGNTACVAYTTEDEAQQAIQQFNGGDFNGSTLEVDVWTAKPAGEKGDKGKSAGKGTKGAWQPPAAKGSWSSKGAPVAKGKGWTAPAPAFSKGWAAPAFGKGSFKGAAMGGSFKGGFKGDGKGKKGKRPDSGLRDIDPSLKVWVGNLPADLSDEDMKTAFEAVGTVTKVVKNASGTGAVVFSTAEEATTAIATFNGGDLNGNVLEVDVWTQKEPKGEGKGKSKSGFKGKKW